jgi:RNA 3'-terminal phosphate cyclase-like protein
MSADSSTGTLRFEDGAVQFRQRIVVSILSNRPLAIRNSMTNGSRIEINNTGTQLRFSPGVLIGGPIEHTCPVPTQIEAGDSDQDSNNSRSIGWFLEGILPLAPFGKEPLSISLTGITDGSCDIDPSVDYLKVSALPLMQHFGIGVTDADDFLSPQAPQIRVVRRGAAPAGGGRVEFYCPVVKDLKPIDLTDVGKFKRVRGTAITCKVISSSMAARVAFAAKGLLHRLLPDVWIHTDAHTIKNHQCGPSPGLCLILTAESTTGMVMSAECCMDHRVGSKRELPEDFGTRGAAMLLEEIRRGGCIDTGVQSLALLWMCLTPEDVSRIRVGTLSQYSVKSLRLFKTALGVEFKVKPDLESKTVLLSCLGTGYRNMARAAT